MEAVQNVADDTSQIDKLKAERTRFLAFSFCWAQLLIELDAGFKVVFAEGPTQAIFGRAPTTLIGNAFDALVADDDVPIGRGILKSMDERRVEGVSIRLKSKAGPTPVFTVAGFRNSDMQGHYFLCLKIGDQPVATGAPVTINRDEKTGLLAEDSFPDIAAEKLNELRAKGEDANFTLVKVPELDELAGRLGKEGGKDLVSQISSQLKEHSVGGDTAAKIGEDGFGLVHDSGVNIDDLKAQITAISKASDPLGKGVAVETATTNVAESDASSEDIGMGLIFTINKFRKTEGRDFSMQGLCDSLGSLATEAAKYNTMFDKAIGDNNFKPVFHPIINIQSGEIHHYESLVRFNMDDFDESPYEAITYAEETGRIHEFDLAMVHKVVEWLNAKPRNSDKYRVAVNISGNSVDKPEYVTALHKLLRENIWLKDKLMFEITESARMSDLESANDFIQSLRKQGYHVCLDDFGAGAASFQYLSTLEVDVVKLDGSAIANAQKWHKGKAFLSALADLCEKMGVETIAEWIENDTDFNFVKECGIDYVQGFLFGKPSLDADDFTQLPSGHLFTGKGNPGGGAASRMRRA